jgi:oligoendopeptidase F
VRLCATQSGFAQPGALQVWANSKRDRAKALGGSRPLPELFAAAGGRFEFSARTIRPLTQLLREELEKLCRKNVRPAGTF